MGDHADIRQGHSKDERVTKSKPLLAFDSRNFAATENASLHLGPVQKYAGNPLFGEEFFAEPPKRWEARLDNVYASVIYDDEADLFKCWYKSFIVDEASVKTPLTARPQQPYFGGEREEGLLYATSRDGLRWHKPALGLIEFEGSRANNIVMRRATHGLHAGGLLKDPRDPDPARRYKFFHLNARAGRMGTCFSADGLRWSQPALWQRHDAVGDTHNNVIWAPELGRYVGITRGWSQGAFQGLRTVLRSESEDFRYWTEPLEIMRGADAHDQIYSMPIVQYAGLYIGLPAVFHKGRKEAADWDTVDTELAWSADTVNWQRICPGQPFIPRGQGSYPDGQYDCGCIYAAAPIFSGEAPGSKIYLYYGGSNGLHNSWREGSLNLATLEADRFAALRSRDRQQNALLSTAPLRLEADCITLNAAIGSGGSLRAALLDGAGASIAGYALEDCLPLKTGGGAIELRWRGKHGTGAPGDARRLLFELRNAALYAIYGASRITE